MKIKDFCCFCCYFKGVLGLWKIIGVQLVVMEWKLFFKIIILIKNAKINCDSIQNSHQRLEQWAILKRFGNVHSCNIIVKWKLSHERNFYFSICVCLDIANPLFLRIEIAVRRNFTRVLKQLNKEINFRVKLGHILSLLGNEIGSFLI